MERLEALNYIGFFYEGEVSPSELISSDVGNSIELGTDGKLFSSGGGVGSTDWSDLTNFASLDTATTPLAGTEEIAIVQGGETKRVAVSDVADTKVDKVTTSGVERVYTINTDGSQGTKVTSDFTTILNTWLVDKMNKTASNNFTSATLLGGNFFGGSNHNVASFKTALGVGIMSGTNANGGGRYRIEPANSLKPMVGLSFYSCFYLGQTTRDNFIRIGFFDALVNTSVIANGAWLQINTASATLNAANNFVSSQSSSSTLTAGVYYECLLEFLTATSITCKIKEILTGTVVFNQTLSTNVPISSSTFACGLIASITTAGTSQSIIHVQELSFGIKPQFLNNF